MPARGGAGRWPMRGTRPIRYPASSRRSAICPCTSDVQERYFVQVPIEAVPFMTDHLLSPLGTRLKQLDGEFFQVVQKPSLLSFQVPSPLTPAFPSGSRVILPSALNTIVYLMFCGVEEVNG